MLFLLNDYRLNFNSSAQCFFFLFANAVSIRYTSRCPWFLQPLISFCCPAYKEAVRGVDLGGARCALPSIALRGLSPANTTRPRPSHGMGPAVALLFRHINISVAIAGNCQ